MNKYGVKHPCLYLIRPDWYVGFRGPASDSEKLIACLEAVFVPSVPDGATSHFTRCG
jgi:hypothetical protein